MPTVEPVEEPQGAVAAEVGVENVDEGEEDAHVLFGAGPAMAVELGHGTNVGGSVFAAYVVAPRWLEVEAAAFAEEGPEGSLFPLVLLAKKPFEVSRLVELFIGIGPELVLIPSREPGGHGDVELGGEAVAGTYLFFSPHVGASVEVALGGVQGEVDGHAETLIETGGSGRLVFRY